MARDFQITKWKEKGDVDRWRSEAGIGAVVPSEAAVEVSTARLEVSEVDIGADLVPVADSGADGVGAAGADDPLLKGCYPAFIILHFLNHTFLKAPPLNFSNILDLG